MEPTIDSEDEFLRLAIVGILSEWMEYDPDAAERWSHLTRDDLTNFDRFSSPLTDRGTPPR